MRVSGTRRERARMDKRFVAVVREGRSRAVGRRTASAAKPALPFTSFAPEAFAMTRTTRAHLAPPFAAARAFSARGAPMMPTHVADIVYSLLPLACVRARCRDPGCLTARARVSVPWRACVCASERCPLLRSCSNE